MNNTRHEISRIEVNKNASPTTTLTPIVSIANYAILSISCLIHIYIYIYIYSIPLLHINLLFTNRLLGMCLRKLQSVDHLGSEFRPGILLPKQRLAVGFLAASL